MINREIIEKAQVWTQPPFDEETQKVTQNLINQQSDELIDAFYTNLDFGTGGLRGIMGVGTNRMNKYTVGMASQGLANYINNHFKEITPSVAIAYDCRNNSQQFAQIASNVLSANNIKVYLFPNLRPTPQLSFAIRHLGCQSGIVITASHNPKEYNGYKVYWQDGGQLVPPHDIGVITEVKKLTSINQVKFNGKPNLIQILNNEIDEAFHQAIKLSNYPSGGKKDLKIVFTPIHGTGIINVPKVLAEAGFNQVTIVTEQSQPDGNFKTVKSPNPEEAAALNIALQLAEKNNADIVLGTDPDSDRVGIAVRDFDNKMVLLNGNQTAAVLFYYVLKMYDAKQGFKGNEFLAKTIVTTELIDAISKKFNVKLYNTLTGFKYIGQLITLKQNSEVFLCGGEESYGYLVGTHVRDKDAVISALVICEAAQWAQNNGTTFFGLLVEIYKTIGFYREHLVSVTKKGKKGTDEIAQLMLFYRSNPPKKLGNINVTALTDYQTSTKKFTNGKTETIDLPKSNVLQFHLADGSLITVRPSGTEPKIKYYFSVKGVLPEINQFKQAWQQLGEKIKAFEADLT